MSRSVAKFAKGELSVAGPDQPRPRPEDCISAVLKNAVETSPSALVLSIVPGWDPPKLNEAQSEAMLAYIGDLEQYLAPGAQDRVQLRIAGLLGHWKSGERQPPEVDEVMGADWVYAIGRYPLWAVARACADWLDLSPFRPHIHDIRALCDKATHDDRVLLDVARRSFNGPLRLQRLALPAGGG